MKNHLCEWHFGEEHGCDDGPNDALAENFNSKPIVSLIRETIQNSLDAVNPTVNKPVKVVYEFGKIPLEEIPNLNNIREHIKGCLDLYPDNDNAIEFFPPMLDYLDNIDDGIDYIKVSDYNTIGMNYINERKTKEPFYAFVRSKGVTAKSQVGSGGSFGFGKAAYFGMSKIKSLLVYTQTNEGKVFFEGVSSLCTHLINNKKVCAVGFYDNNNGRPIEDEQQIPNFFKRSTNISGTDFWILGYDKKAKEEIIKLMVEATLRNFWLAIHTGTLEIQIDDYKINKENLNEVLKSYFEKTTDTAKWREKYNPRPYFEAVLHGKEQTNKFKYIRRKLKLLGEVSLYAFLSKEGSNKIILTRKPKMLVQIKNVSPIGIYAVFTCDNEIGNTLLQQMENPAHNSWSATRKKDIREAYIELENFITSSIDELKPQSGKQNLQVMGLSDLTWIPESLLNDEETDDESIKGGSKNSEFYQNNNQENGSQKSNLISILTTTKKAGRAQVIETTFVDSEEDDLNGGYTSSYGSGSPSNNKSNKKGGNGGSMPGNGNGNNPGENIGNNSIEELNREGYDLEKTQIVLCKFKQYALKEKGKIVHHLFIDSPKNVKKGNLSIYVNTEDGFVKLLIKKAIQESTLESLEVSDNKITNISLIKGYNKIAIVFFDNIKHSLKLEVDECK